MANFQSPGKYNSNFSGTTISSWSRQQKIALIAGFIILGFLIAMSACSKQASKPALTSISKPEAAAPATLNSAGQPAPVPTQPVAKKKAKKRPAAIVTYSDPNSGLSFRYPRKYELATGENALTEDNSGVKMNFVQPGGMAVATVAVPSAAYPGTDFNAAFFNVNVNRTISEQECSQFAFVDTRNPDGEAVDPEKVEVGPVSLAKTTDFTGDGMKQSESQYFHRYENGACYEFVLGLDTAGFGTEESVTAVNRDEIFGKLEKILESVKIQPVEVEEQQVAAQTTSSDPTAK